MRDKYFLKRKVFDCKDMTYRFEDGSAPIPAEFRIETNLMIAQQEATGTPLLMAWLGRLWALKDFLKRNNPDWDKPTS